MDRSEEVTENKKSEIISVGQWVLYLFIFSIPLINIIVLCIWAFGDQRNPTKTNFGKAGLIWAVIVIVLYVLFFFVMIGIFSANFHRGTLS